MRKLLVILLGAGALAACSSTNTPQPQSNVVYNNCSDAKAQVRSNHEQISQAFAHRDADTIGTLELQNWDIVHANMKCFPNVQKQMKYWEKMHKDMTS